MTDKNIEASFIIPVLNEEKYLRSTLESIVNQNTLTEYEIVVSDGGSTDNTLEIAKEYADIVVNCTDKGIGLGRHLGALHASKSSDYYIFIDSDTILPSHFLSWAMHKFNTQKEIVAFSSKFEFSEHSPTVKFAEKMANQYFQMRKKIISTTLPGFNTCVRKNAYYQSGGYRNMLLEDVDFSRRIAKVGDTTIYSDMTIINSSRRLEGMGLIGSIYYYAQLDIGRMTDSTKIDKLAKALGIADLREYIGIR